MRPEIFNFYFEALVQFCKRPQLHVLTKAIRNIGVQIDGYFAAASLGLYDDCQGDPFVARVRCPHFRLLIEVARQYSAPHYSMISSAERLSSFDPAALSRLRKSRATRPERPITLPKSVSASSSSMTVSSPSTYSSIKTSSLASTIALAMYSIMARGLALGSIIYVAPDYPVRLS